MSPILLALALNVVAVLPCGETALQDNPPINRDTLVIGCVSSNLIPEGCRSLLTAGDGDMDSLVFVSTIGGIGPTNGWINVNGADIKLQLVKSTRPRGKKYQGEEFLDRFSAGDIRVTVHYVVTRPSTTHRGPQECSALITVRRGTTVQTLRARGTRGCS